MTDYCTQLKRKGVNSWYCVGGNGGGRRWRGKEGKSIDDGGGGNIAVKGNGGRLIAKQGHKGPGPPFSMQHVRRLKSWGAQILNHGSRQGPRCPSPWLPPRELDEEYTWLGRSFHSEFQRSAFLPWGLSIFSSKTAYCSTSYHDYVERCAYSITAEHRNLRKSYELDGPVWPKHVVNLHESMD